MKLRITAAVLAVLSVIGVGYVAKSTVPDSAIELPFDDVLNTRSIAPQGWAFFTRSPREANASIWARDNEEWVRIDAGTNVSWENGLGIGRKPRAESIRLGNLLTEVQGNKSEPTACESKDSLSKTVSTCLDELVPVPVDRTTYPWTLCGDIGVISQEPLPWVWASRSIDEEMPATAQRLMVDCEGVRS